MPLSCSWYLCLVPLSLITRTFVFHISYLCLSFLVPLSLVTRTSLSRTFVSHQRPLSWFLLEWAVSCYVAQGHCSTHSIGHPVLMGHFDRIHTCVISAQFLLHGTTKIIIFTHFSGLLKFLLRIIWFAEKINFRIMTK